MTLLCFLFCTCGGSFGSRFLTGSLTFFFNRNCFLKFYGDIDIFFGNKSFGITIDHNLNPVFVLSDDFETFLAGNQSKYGTIRIFGFTNLQSFRIDCGDFSSEFINHFFGTVTDGKIIGHNITFYLTGFDLNPVTDFFYNLSSAAAVQFSDDFAVCIWFLSDIYIICGNRNTDIFIFGFRFWRRSWFSGRFRCRSCRIDRCAGSGIGIGLRCGGICGSRFICKSDNCLRIRGSASGLAVYILIQSICHAGKLRLTTHRSGHRRKIIPADACDC